MSNGIYYGHIDKAEPAGSDFYLEFHCLDQYEADRILPFASEHFQKEIMLIKDQVITLQNTFSTIQSIFKTDNLPETESDWVILHTNKSNIGLEARLFTDDNEAEEVIYISEISQIPPDQPPRQLLDKQVSLDTFSDALDDDIISVLEAGNVSRAEFTAVYNVGQGNCNAVCNDLSMPMLYFDLGGGCYTNKHTYPKALDFCFSHHPSILLSHWDTDHFQSAKMNPLYKTKNWIMPRQPIGPVHLKFFLSITGKKLIWSKYPSINFTWGTILLCTGSKRKKNHSGLAFDAHLHGSQNTIVDVLLPGDAAYTYIPGCCAAVNYDGIIATHHGADFDYGNNPVPIPKGKKAIAWSFGVNNTYRHPRISAVSAHAITGWDGKVGKITENGHIAMTDNGTVPRLGCGGHDCQLQIVQTY